MNSIDQSSDGSFDLWMWLDGKYTFMGNYPSRELAQSELDRLNNKFGFSGE